MKVLLRGRFPARRAWLEPLGCARRLQPNQSISFSESNIDLLGSVRLPVAFQIRPLHIQFCRQGYDQPVENKSRFLFFLRRTALPISRGRQAWVVAFGPSCRARTATLRHAVRPNQIVGPVQATLYIWLHTLTLSIVIASVLACWAIIVS